MRFTRAAICSLTVSFLVGCQTVPVAVCPQPVVYSEGQQAEAADELLTLPPGSILTQMMLDYGQLRAKLRACQQ